MNLYHEAHGEVVSFARGFALRAAACFFIGFVLLLVGALVVVVAFVNWDVGSGSDILVIGMPGLGFIAAAAFFFWKCWDLLTRTPRLVLNHDRMMWVERRRVHWEVDYEHVAAIELFNGLLGTKAIGIRLHLPGSSDEKEPRLPWRWRLWQAQRNRFGFDIVLPPRHCSEPTERVLETALTCLHRFRRIRESAQDDLFEKG